MQAGALILLLSLTFGSFEPDEPVTRTHSGTMPMLVAVDCALKFQPPGGSRLAKKEGRFAARVTRIARCPPTSMMS